METPEASVVVISFNSEATIRLCLESLMSLDYPRDKYEIVVVDGGSTDRTREIVQSYDLKLFVSNSGLRGFDRNVGVRKSIGEIIAFTDSDCRVPENWLTAHVRDHRDKAVGAVGGGIVNPFLSDYSEFARLMYYEKYGDLCGIREGRYVDHAATCNASFKRRALERAGLFEETAHIYEDFILCHQIRRLGYRVFFDPKIEVINYGGNADLDAEAFLRLEEEAARRYYHAQTLYRRLHSVLPLNPHMVLISTPLVILGRIIRVMYKLKRENRLAQVLKLFPHVLFSSMIFGIAYAREAYEGTIHREVAIKDTKVLG